MNYYQSNSRTHKLNKIQKGEHWKLTANEEEEQEAKTDNEMKTGEDRRVSEGTAESQRGK